MSFEPRFELTLFALALCNHTFVEGVRIENGTVQDVSDWRTGNGEEDKILGLGLVLLCRTSAVPSPAVSPGGG